VRAKEGRHTMGVKERYKRSVIKAGNVSRSPSKSNTEDSGGQIT